MDIEIENDLTLIPIFSMFYNCPGNFNVFGTVKLCGYSLH